MLCLVAPEGRATARAAGVAATAIGRHRKPRVARSLRLGQEIVALGLDVAVAEHQQVDLVFRWPAVADGQRCGFDWLMTTHHVERPRIDIQWEMSLTLLFAAWIWWRVRHARPRRSCVDAGVPQL